MSLLERHVALGFFGVGDGAGGVDAEAAESCQEKCQGADEEHGVPIRPGGAFGQYRRRTRAGQASIK